jgi:hypothetical protein
MAPSPALHCCLDCLICGVRWQLAAPRAQIGVDESPRRFRSRSAATSHPAFQLKRATKLIGCGAYLYRLAAFLRLHQ